MLKHFVTMTYEVKNPNTRRHITVLSLCWLLLAYIAKGDTALVITFTTFGVLGLAFILLRTNIAVSGLSKKDEHYKKDGEVLMTFGHKSFVVESEVSDEVKRLNYSEVTSLYKDKLFYFLGINNEEMQVISRAGLQGADEEFETFMIGKVGRDFYEVNLPIVQETKRRWVRFKYNYQMKKLEAEEQQDNREARIQEKKRNKKKKK